MQGIEVPHARTLLQEDMDLPEFPRYRASSIHTHASILADIESESAWVSEDKLDELEDSALYLLVYTRQGYDGEENCYDDDAVAYNETIREHELWMFDYQDGFDQTYRSFILRIPEEIASKHQLRKLFESQ